MSWRIEYWRGPVRIRTTTLQNATPHEAASYLKVLAAKHLDLEYLRASEAEAPGTPEIRSNRDGTMFWTTGKDFHYTAEWFGDDDSPKRKQ